MKLLRKYKICSHISQKSGELCYVIKKRCCLIFWVNLIYKEDGASRYFRTYDDVDEASKILDHLETYR